MNSANWSWVPIGDLFDIGAGKTMSRSAREGKGRVPFLRTSNVLWDEIDLSQLDEMAVSSEEIAEKSVARGDLFVCEGGEIGRAAVWEGSISPLVFQNHLHRLRPKTADLVPRFYVYFLQSAFTQLGIFEGAGNKTTIPNLSRNRLASLEVPVPPLGEQREIANTLVLVRTAERLHSHATSQAEELKRTAMRELFMRGFRGEPQKETEIGLMPESWDLVAFKEIREWLQYGTSTRCSLEPSAFTVLRIPNVESGKVNVNELKYCNLPENEAQKYLLEDGDILFIRTNGVLDRLGSCAVYSGNPERALFASYLIRARLKKSVMPKYVAHFFGSERGTALFADRATPAADGKYNLNTGAIDSLLLPLPRTLFEQEQMVAILDAIDRKIEVHRRKKKVLEELFQALLHKLMTGEIRVADLDLSVLEDAQKTRDNRGEACYE